ncbi:ATP synthase subunit delta, mitochondrial-like [Anneissia japonica]|uniref:ATP synthase subunit delta, mitochondrial-like n=1 Tax=Anneissia japonica TaxID=1529436 RepID=UPI001425A9D9|nr:ATP synthase subunit delta, mitochondrial-like [Anneissia japonica]
MSFLRNCSRLLRPCINSPHNKIVRGYAEEAAAAIPAGQMAFTFGCPSKIFYKAANVKQIDVPSTTGSFGILAQHVPALAVLKPGLLSVHEENGDITKFFVSSGSVTIHADSSVQVLAEVAVPLEELDPQAIKEGLSKANQDLAAATTDVAKAEAQIAVEVHEALEQAVGK